MLGSDYPVWTDTPACTGIDVEMFFTDDNLRYSDLQGVIKICNTCPVIQQCFDYAIKYNVNGVWGGTSEAQRRAYRKLYNVNVLPVIPS